MKYEEWLENYKPIQNTLVKGAPYDGLMFETFGKEAEFLQTQQAKNIWTLIDTEGNKEVILAGVWRFNRLGYFVTEVPWENDYQEVEF